MVRKATSGQDENMKWFIADAGSYVWPNDDFPLTDPPATPDCKTDASNCDMVPACNTTKSQWPYGMDITDPSTMNPYVRDRVVANKADVINTYLQRRMQYTIAQLDDGQGDTHCQAQFQGPSHNTRGWNLIAELQKLKAPNMVNTTVPNATHVDEEVFIDPASQYWLFVDAMNDARNGSTASGSSSSKSGGGKSGNSSSSGGKNGSSSGAASLQQREGAAKAVALLAIGFTAAASLSLGLF